MIHGKDLTPGSFVFDLNGPRVLLKKYKVLTKINEVSDRIYNNWAPVILNDEFLEMLGFMEMMDPADGEIVFKNWRHMGSNMIISKCVSGNIRERDLGFAKGKWYYGDHYVEFEAVHELQRVFKTFTGKDLTFRLPGKILF